MLEHCNILIVDDNADNLKVVSGYLREANYNLILALSGEEALVLMKENPIDLVLLDIMMPGMDGYEVARRMKDDDALQHIPIVFLTALDDTPSIVKGFALGGADYVSKPFKKMELLVRINHQVELIRAHQIIEQKNSELEQIIKSRKAIYAVVAHDIRGPFVEIMSFIDMLNKGHVKPGDDNYQEVINSLSRKTHATNDLLSNLLSWSLIEMKKVTCNQKSIMLSPVIEDMLSHFSVSLSDKEIQVVQDIANQGIMASVDPDMLNTILRNLIANAVKFTPRGGSITIRLFKEDAKVFIEVIDSGLGMDKETVDTILSGNSVSTRGTENEKGTGLGLQLVMHFAKLMGATIDIRSEKGKGSAFLISLHE